MPDCSIYSEGDKSRAGQYIYPLIKSAIEKSEMGQCSIIFVQ